MPRSACCSSSAGHCCTRSTSRPAATTPTAARFRRLRRIDGVRAPPHPRWSGFARVRSHAGERRRACKASAPDGSTVPVLAPRMPWASGSEATARYGVGSSISTAHTQLGTYGARPAQAGSGCRGVRRRDPPRSGPCRPGSPSAAHPPPRRCLPRHDAGRATVPAVDQAPTRAANRRINQSGRIGRYSSG